MKTAVIDDQISQMIKQQEADEKAADMCRRHGSGQATVHHHKSNYGRMEPLDVKTRRTFGAYTYRT